MCTQHIHIFTVAAPAIGSSPPAAAGIASGDSGVATQTGAFTYSYPITVPPGRNGMQPGLALSYSSQAPIYGTLAAGWTLSGIPIITEDTSRGALNTGSADKSYVSSMAGGRPLNPVTEPAASGAVAYRAQHDAGWVRYERHDESSTFWWRAYAPDGTTYYFGDRGAHTSNCSIISAGYAPLTRIADPFGNQVDYVYQEGVDGECVIAAITWGQNTSAGIGDFAAIEFNYGGRTGQTPTCSGIPVGQQLSLRTGSKIVTGARTLHQIRIAAFPPQPGSLTATPIPTATDHVRTISLSYNTTEPTFECIDGSSPYRALLKIVESASGTDAPLVTSPPLEFRYGASASAYDTLPADLVACRTSRELAASTVPAG